jgi:hypothetical protein
MKQMTQKHVDEILTKQFEMVGQTYSPEKVKDERWYLQYYWTKEQETRFRKWLIDYITRERLAGIKRAEKEADYFLFYCGWPLKEFMGQ